MPQKIAFCHIHKTAGTTVSTYLKSNYRPEEVFPGEGLQTVTQRQIDQINDYSLVVGHFPLSFLRAFLNSEWKIVTVLRDPIARFVSHLRFNHELMHGAAANTSPLDMGPVAEEAVAYGNWQTRFLGARLPGDEWRYLVASRRAITYQWAPVWQQSGIESALRFAKEELQQIDWILDDTRLLQGLRRVALECGLWPVEELPRSNRGLYRGVDDAPAGQGLRDIAAASNVIDLQLYRAGQKKLTKELTAVELTQLRSGWMARYAPSRTCAVAADHGFMGTGWRGPFDAADGNTFNWSDSSLLQELYLPITTAGRHEIELSMFLPDRQPGFRVAIEWHGRTHDPVDINAEGDQVNAIFRPDTVVSDLLRLQRLRIISDCTTQTRSGGGLPNAGFIFNGAISRSLV